MIKPGTITTLAAQANDPQRVNVFIDGAFAIGVSLSTITREKLFVGKPLDTAAIDRLADTEDDDKALQAALRFIDARPRASAEVRDRLRRQEIPDATITRVLERLVELELIDDAAFARRWVEQRLNGKPRGSGALRDELRRKGVDRAIVDATLDDDELVGDETGRAEEVGRQAMQRYASSRDRMTFSRKLGGYLMRRGFDGATVRQVTDKLWQELQESK